VLAAVAAGAGATVLPRCLCSAAPASGAVLPLLAPEDPPINTGFLVERAGAPSRTPVAAVRGRLLEAARSW
jgi:DNA-binding transcriptional LysR family regulator